MPVEVENKTDGLRKNHWRLRKVKIINTER